MKDIKGNLMNEIGTTICSRCFRWFTFDLKEGHLSPNYCGKNDCIEKHRGSNKPLDVYVGENRGLGTYVRSRSHYNELIKEKNLKEVGTDKLPEHHNPHHTEYQ